MYVILYVYVFIRIRNELLKEQVITVIIIIIITTIIKKQQQKIIIQFLFSSEFPLFVLGS